jgi:hypothetical protein
MPLLDQLPSDVQLSPEERAELIKIERAATKSGSSLIVDAIAAASVPALFMAGYGYLIHLVHRSLSPFALCKLVGPFYIPEPERLEKMLRLPMGMLFFTAILWSLTALRLHAHRRLLHKILSHDRSRSNGAQ